MSSNVKLKNQYHIWCKHQKRKKHIQYVRLVNNFPKKKQESRDLDKDLKGLRPENKPTTLCTTEILNKVESSISNIVKKSQENLTKELKGLRPEKRPTAFGQKRTWQWLRKTQQQSWNNLEWLIFPHEFSCWKDTNCYVSL